MANKNLTVMKDAVGQELHVGDRVAYIITDSYTGMRLIGENAVQTGTISKINPKTVEIKNTSWNHASWLASGSYYQTRKVPHRVIKIAKE